MTETHTPLPCPLCHAEAPQVYESRYHTHCNKCGTVAPTRSWNTRAVNSHHDLIEALRAIQRATLEGRVCDDVAWFDQVTTLHDYIEDVLHPFEPAAIGDLFPDTAALTKAEAGHG